MIASLTVVVGLAGVSAGGTAQGEPKLSCSEPTNIILPLAKSDARWPTQGWRFACFPKQVEVSIVSMQSRADSSRWTPPTSTMQTSVVDEGPLRLELTGICSGSSGKVGVLEGSLKWGGFGLGLRNCEAREFEALRLQIQVRE